VGNGEVRVTTHLENLEVQNGQEKSGEMGKVRVTLKSASLCSYIPMTRIIYQLNQFDKRKYLV